ncbi:MAG: S-methyl-5-thioribose-1-phosphate isomerase, partial [Bacteroidales bacterium]|nr:S-methyl-5-thioribose-1-phosphate isomerase [Bacteroidales bacterium]
PTAVNLSHALQRQLNGSARVVSMEDKTKTALETALEMAEEEKEACRLIGEYGLPLIEEISHRKPDAPVNILTHCNAGWLASIDYGTATAPVYLAHDRGIRVHVWVDETRPRNQGTRLTAWELKQHGIPFTVITDNAGGYLMQKGMVDLVLVGSDRTAINGDVANKTGTYLKALAAHDNNIPFYAALPSSSIDPTLDNGSLIPIEERDPNEVRFIEGYSGGKTVKMRLTPLQSPAANPAFDITPARLVSGLITERGICKAERADIVRLFPEFTNQ